MHTYNKGKMLCLPLLQEKPKNKNIWEFESSVLATRLINFCLDFAVHMRPEWPQWPLSSDLCLEVCVWEISSICLGYQVFSFSCIRWMMESSTILLIDVGSDSPWSLGCWPHLLWTHIWSSCLCSFTFTLHQISGVNLIFRSSLEPWIWFTLPDTYSPNSLACGS